MRFLLPIAVGLPLLLVTGCREAVEPPVIDLDAVYERTDRDFESGVMFRPDDAAYGQS